MRFFLLIFILLADLLHWSAAFADSANPKICVALSGGGARGFAHIGVLKYLEELHIPVNCIAGTSMGAVVGGLYASGMSVSEIERNLKDIHLGNVALDIVDRRKISETLRQDDMNYPISGTFGLSKNGISLPLGAVQANQFLEILQNWTSHLPPNISFDQLSIPFRAVATDLESGEMIVFDQGPIATAIRASMAAPGVFTPIEINGRLLADGGLVRNLPVDIARSMGADIIIAVNIGTPLFPRDNLTNFFTVTRQMLGILTGQNVNAQKKLLLPQDILIDADLGNITFMEFERAEEAASKGYQAARALHDQLATLSLSPEDYVAQLHARPDPTLPEVRIAFVDVHSKGDIPSEDIRRQLNIPIGSVYNAIDINSRIAALINSNQYDSILPSLVQRGDEYGLEIDATARRWGPNFIRLGLELATGFDGQSSFEVQVGHRLPWINDSGLEWRNDIQFGTTYGIRSELRQPLIVREGSYMAPYVDTQLKPLSLYSDNSRVADYAVQSTQLGFDFGVPLGEHGTKGEVRTGLFATHHQLHPKIGGIKTLLPDNTTSITTLATVRLDELAVHSSFIVDQLNAPFFPSEGYRFGGEIIAGLNRLNSDSPTVPTYNDFRGYQQATFEAMWAKSVGDNSVNLSMKLGARSQSGEAIPGLGLSLGGFQKLSAYQPDQFFGNYLLYGNATYLFRAIDFGMAGEAAFLGTSLELGNVGNNHSDFSLGNLRKSLSVFVGAKTFVGPVYFGVAVAPAGAFNLFLRLGRQ